jgi:hypothetical protein
LRPAVSSRAPVPNLARAPFSASDPCRRRPIQTSAHGNQVKWLAHAAPRSLNISPLCGLPCYGPDFLCDFHLDRPDR